MNISDFMLTAEISLIIGVLLGYFLRDIVGWGMRMYRQYVQRSRYFEHERLSTKKKSHS